MLVEAAALGAAGADLGAEAPGRDILGKEKPPELAASALLTCCKRESGFQQLIEGHSRKTLFA
jgi:hypothetical protein